MIDDIKLEFKGFKPNEKINNEVAHVTERLYLNSPSDSFIKLVFEKSKNKIHATCKIISQSGTFIADAINDNPIQIFRQIEEQIQKQIEDWRARRFDQNHVEKNMVRASYLGA